MTSIKLGAQIKAGSFNFYSDGSTREIAHKNIYPVDLNSDGIEEIIFAGFETQPNTPRAYSNTSIHIFGWQNDKLQEITDQWLPKKTNQVEGVGDIAFGDFNGDGLIDAYISGYADMDYSINAYALMNKGNTFEKVNLGLTQWEHGVAAGDINLDGFSDIVVAGYIHPSVFFLGGKDGLSKHIVMDDQTNSFSSWETFGSGVAIADFFGDGSVSVVMVDSAPADGPSDTRLLRVVNDNQGVPIGFKYISTLPIPRLELPKYNNLANAKYENSHDIRAEPFDFTNDGLMDVVVFSIGGWNGNEWPKISEVQFLKNKGDGIFEDVTDSKLIGYNNKTNMAYNPIIADFNNDGLKDIYLSADIASSGSTAILIQKSNGTFVETARNQLSPIVQNYGTSNIVLGPDKKYFMIVEKNLTPENNGIQNISAYKITFIENRAPTLSKSLADVNVNEGKSIIFSLSTAFKDPDNADILTYSVSLEDGAALPNWLSFNTVTKKLVGTLPYSTDTNILVKVTATDNDGLSVSDVFSINVTNVSNINGTNGSNIIVAGAGNDTINGGLGNDTLTGGLGNDTFVFNTKLGATNIDTITDFTNGDKIALAGSIFSKLKGDKDLSDNLYVQSIVGITTRDDNVTNDYLFYELESGRLYYDADGYGSGKDAVQIAIIGTGGISLTANDFSIV